jgi:DNA helicase-2/ATP-dependent DNA helicase PcrA
MADYLENVALITDLDNDNPDDRNKVTIMTMHSAKGLEFNNVYIAGVEEELFPSRMSFESPEEMEEERRLFYVAITRAKKRVFISYAQNRYKWGTPTMSQPSRFLRDIDPKYLDLPVEQLMHTADRNYDGNDRAGDFHNKSRYRNNGNAKTFTGSMPQKSGSLRTNTLVPGKTATPARPVSAGFVPDDPDRIQTGMKVEHATFGIGKILHIEGLSPNRKATVFFQETNEEKQLLLKFAKLRILAGE